MEEIMLPHFENKRDENSSQETAILDRKNCLARLVEELSDV
jgi:hypothetical protein